MTVAVLMGHRDTTKISRVYGHEHADLAGPAGHRYGRAPTPSRQQCCRGNPVAGGLTSTPGTAPRIAPSE